MVIAPQDFATEAVIDAAGRVPVVVIADAPGLNGVVQVSVDQPAGAELAVAHLIDRGHRSIAHLSGPTDWFDAAARIRGWRSTLERAGLECGPMLAGDWSVASGYRAAVSLIGSGLPDAIFAANDEMALGVLRAFRERGISVPDDVGVVGFDDVAGSAYFDPPLTTVRQEFGSLGALAVRSLRDLLGAADVPSSGSYKIPPAWWSGRALVGCSSGPARVHPPRRRVPGSAESAERPL